MEKATPHYQLADFQAAAKAGTLEYTWTANDDADALEMTLDDIDRVIIALTRADFYKSMTTHRDHTVWQDVYKPHDAVSGLYLYIKLTNSEGTWVISFKEQTL